MATLQECLQQLPGDMRMIDLPEPGHVVLTVTELLAKHQRIEHKYETRDQKVMRKVFAHESYKGLHVLL
ncbi:hypothetical protein VQ574_21065 (plasmid) [Stutzerimonas frequens]|uniref:hypothetical protein n=1 Tax=Stutzerimonas frequens TaxID=2968969 RepID=UPI002DBFA91B|nr:hypothetical protein [Stutzerimonas frequens]WRW29430.1 hypothetical protein VQ574_21065 [Stutzerimonas frequens]